MTINRRSGEPNSKVMRIQAWVRENISVGKTFESTGDIVQSVDMPAKFISRILNEWEGDMVSIERRPGHCHRYTRLK